MSCAVCKTEAHKSALLTDSRRYIFLTSSKDIYFKNVTSLILEIILWKVKPEKRDKCMNK